MYSSEKNPGINWKDLIIKAIFLVLFLLLLVWLFPKVPNMKPFYSNVFRENIKYMQDAAESYYTTDKLPKNVGDTAEMTLQEMINKNLILPFVDEDGNECDTKESYVQVIKNKNDYTLRVNLVCPKEENHVDKTLGCYQYCEECEQTKEELEYQFKKASTVNKTTYSCPNGGTLVNGMCNIYDTTTYKASEKTSQGENYCPNGGTLSGDKCYVTKTTSYNASTKSGKYYCEYGGTLSGTKCYVDDSYTYSASTSYSCPKGGTLSGTNCYTTSTLASTSYNASIKDYTCNGKTQSSSVCTSGSAGSTYTASVKNYTCNGKVQTSSTCSTTTAGSSYAAKATTTSTTKTIKTTGTLGTGYTLISEGYEYTCSNHIQCPKRVYYRTYSYKEYKTTYSCPNGGTLNGTTCKIAGTTKTITGTPNYYCPNGGSLNGKTCTIASTTKTTAATPNYYCPNGGTLNGTKCVKAGSTSTDTYAATAKRTCPKGGTLSGTKCYIDDSYTYTATRSTDSKYCPNGGILSGDKCYVTDETSYKASNKVGQTVYSCPDGGTLDGKTCSIYKLKSSYAATAKTTPVTVYEYKWSSEKTLEGWTATGETRVKGSK